MSKMNELEFSENSTGKSFKGKSFLYKFMSSVREKVNAPIKKAITKKNQDEITASNNSATMFVILIIGLTAGPAVSL